MQFRCAEHPALVRLRADAYATGSGANDVARDILDRRLKHEAD